MNCLRKQYLLLVGAVAFFVFADAALGYPMRDSYTYMPFDGNPLGLTALDGKEILPCVYAGIRSVGNGIFVANSIDKEDRYKWGESHVINANGKELVYKVPPGTVFRDVFSLGIDADKDITKSVDVFPLGTLLRFSTSFENGLCTPEGKIFIPLRPGVICYVKPGLAYSSPRDSNHPNNSSCFIDLKTGNLEVDKKDSGPSMLTTRTNYQEDPKLHPQFIPIASIPYMVTFPIAKSTTYRLIAPGRLLKRLDADDREFHRDYWLENRDSPIPRFVMFNRFLKQYNLIGMNQDQVLELLGTGSSGPFGGPGIEYDGYNGDIASLTQSLGGGGCMPQLNMRFCIHFNRGKVHHWNFAYLTEHRSEEGTYIPGLEESAPISSNVVIPTAEARDRPGFQRIIGRPNGQQESRFPETVQK